MLIFYGVSWGIHKDLKLESVSKIGTKRKTVDLDQLEEKSKNPMVKEYGVTWTLYKCETCKYLEPYRKSFRCIHHKGRHYPSWDACGLYRPRI